MCVAVGNGKTWQSVHAWQHAPTDCVDFLRRAEILAAMSGCFETASSMVIFRCQGERVLGVECQLEARYDGRQDGRSI